MASLLKYAMHELDLIGMTEDSTDDWNKAMRDHILHMVKEFSDEGHSGMSASYALNILKNLLDFKPLTPLTGADDEWTMIDYVGDMIAQNKRCFHVFRGDDGRAYDIAGIIFYEWCTDENGKRYKSHFTSKDSRVYITFPYTPTNEYREVIR
jgi:hypothetical protein